VFARYVPSVHRKRQKDLPTLAATSETTPPARTRFHEAIALTAVADAGGCRQSEILPPRDATRNEEAGCLLAEQQPSACVMQQRATLFQSLPRVALSPRPAKYSPMPSRYIARACCNAPPVIPYASLSI